MSATVSRIAPNDQLPVNRAGATASAKRVGPLIAALTERDRARAQQCLDAYFDDDAAAAAAQRSAGTLGFPVLSLEAMLEPEPDANYWVPGLDIAPGRPVECVAMGYGKKTVSMLQAGVNGAMGQPVWGRFPCRRVRWCHVDFESGIRIVKRRIRRLVRAAGGDFDQLVREGWIALVSMPPMYLNTDGALEELTRLMGEYGLVTWDSLRRSLPGADENSSTEMAKHLDILTRASLATDSVLMYAHHASTKATPDGQPLAGRGRGSSAIYDGSGTVLNFESKGRGLPSVVTCTRTGEGQPLPEPFELEIVDVEIDGEPNAGLIVRARDVEAQGDVADRKGIELRFLIQQALTKVNTGNRPRSLASKGAVAAALGKRRELVGAPIDGMLADGTITLIQNKNVPDEYRGYWLTEHLPAELKGWTK